MRAATDLSPAAARLTRSDDSLPHACVTGINLSGGQKQRISVARAVYCNADIYLFDDPLSALDAKVGAKLFHGCIKEHLANKTRILVTNQLQFMPEVDEVVVMDEGRIVEQGTYHALMASNGKLTQLMQDMGGMSDEEEEDADEAKAESKAAPGAAAATTSGAGAGAGAGAGVAATDIVLQKALTHDEKKKLAKAKEKGKLVTAEHRETGSLSWSVYSSYIKAAGGMKFFVGLLGFYLVSEVARVSSSYWLGVWSADELGASVGTYMGVYFGLSLLQTTLSGGSSYVGAVGSVAASRVLHEQMVNRILRAPMRFFDATPIGRVINRFTKVSGGSRVPAIACLSPY